MRGEKYRLAMVQIPLLRGVGSLILCVYVLLYFLLVAPPFSWSQYLGFVAILAIYCAGSWLILRAAYRRVKTLDLSLLFLIVDFFFWILVLYRTGADKSLLFFLGVVRLSDQRYTTFRRVMTFAHLSVAVYALFIV